MNPENQKQQNTNPDLDFIRNASDPLEAPAKKRLDKKIIIIIILVVITLVIMVVGMVTGANKKVQKSTDSAGTNKSVSVSPETQSKAEDVVESFFDKVSAQDYNGAYSLFSQSPDISYQEFIDNSVPYLSKLDLTSCNFTENKEGLIDESGNIQRTYACDNKKQNHTVNLQFSLRSDNEGNVDIYGYYIVSAS